MNRGDYIKAKEFIGMGGEYIGGDGKVHYKECICEGEILLIINEPNKDTFILRHIQRRDTALPITSRVDKELLNNKFEICARPLHDIEVRYKHQLLEYLNKKYKQNEAELKIKSCDRWCEGVNNILVEIIEDIESDGFMELSRPMNGLIPDHYQVVYSK